LKAAYDFGPFNRVGNSVSIVAEQFGDRLFCLFD